MRFRQLINAVLAIATSVTAATASASDTQFTYQGELKENGSPVNGNFNFRFRLFATPTGGTALAAQVINGVPVSDGLFTVAIDFAAAVFDNNDRWLEITVGTTTLSPRQPVRRTPYSIQTRGIFVDDAYRVGIGTTAPENALH